MSTATYANQELTRADVDAARGTTVLEFGATWCPICQSAQPIIAEALSRPRLNRIMVEDGPGRPLGRSFRVKLWPTLVFLHDGIEISRVVRPRTSEDLAGAVAQIEEVGGS